MGAPITWRNVEAPDLRGVASMFQLASNGFNSGFEKLNQVLQNEQATTEANWKVQRDNNTQAFLNSINQFRTPEDYQAALASGALDPGKYGAQIDQAAARSALDGRLSILQDRTTKANQFADQAQERDARPIVDRLNVMALSEDKAVRQSAKEALGIYAENGMVPKASEVASNIRNTEHQNVTWDREGIKFDREGKKLDSDLKTAAAQRGLMGAQAEHYRNESSSSTASLKTALATSKAERAAAELKIKNSPLDAGTMDTFEGKKKFAEGLKAIGITDPEVVDSIHQSFSKDYGNGVLVGKSDKGEDVRIGLPVATALAAVEGAKKDWMVRPNWLVGSGRGGRASDRVKALMSEPSYVDSLQEALQAQGMQYRPLTQAGSSGPVASASANSTATRRIGIPRPSQDMGDYTGADLVSQTVNARADRNARALEMMTAEERQKAKDNPGWVPFRVKKFLEAGNQY